MDCIFPVRIRQEIKEKYEEKENFVIDRTAPVIEVFYEDESASNIRYFNHPRTAEIVIREQNFDEIRLNRYRA